MPSLPFTQPYPSLLSFAQCGVHQLLKVARLASSTSTTPAFFSSVFQTKLADAERYLAGLDNNSEELADRPIIHISSCHELLCHHDVGGLFPDLLIQNHQHSTKSSLTITSIASVLVSDTTRACILRVRCLQDCSPSTEFSLYREADLAPRSLWQLAAEQGGMDYEEDVSQLRVNPSVNIDYIPGREVVSLAELLQLTHMSGRMRLLLSCTLADMFWKSYGGPWIQGRWNKHIIQFMLDHQQDNSHQIHLDKPHLLIALGGDDEVLAHDSGFKTHDFPGILALGKLLLEIIVGIDIEGDRRSNPGLSTITA
ncbi:hypothetical protein BO94DRAFT_585558 [Aspergillus sclerotioniger CBS 115572]|uniref:DUF7580 domain-containing protein n=1 Tax=Aspergillus sclerotioniger CBS 115572 TaxID=1450535 RepID=A0A317WS00_9EURO|nr:hypothetical protein BO94DRAFT_585558 [Aspergillus sclerotioniger CBS 115572]PWY88102.1 hypothetical protein BO94DRAFT_585558 [Aspergillus sclerotioniger CBS 115572]